jgi:hypothetical protein
MALNPNRNLTLNPFRLLTEPEQGIKIMMKSKTKRVVVDLSLH